VRPARAYVLAYRALAPVLVEGWAEGGSLGL